MKLNFSEIRADEKLSAISSLSLPLLIRQLFSFPVPSPGSPIRAQPRIVDHLPFTFCRTFRHIVGLALLLISAKKLNQLDHRHKVICLCSLFFHSWEQMIELNDQANDQMNDQRSNLRFKKFAWAQSYIGSVWLSNGSAHFGSVSLLQSQHLMENTKRVHQKAQTD